MAESSTPSSVRGAPALARDVSLLRDDPPPWLSSIDDLTIPAYACPAVVPHPLDSEPVARNDPDTPESRVRASLSIPRGPGSTTTVVPPIRVEMDVDVSSYPSDSELPRLWVRSYLSGVGKDGSVEAFDAAVRASRRRERNPLETVLWHFAHRFLGGSDGVDRPPRLRFEVGAEVLANAGVWRPGTVVAVWDGGYPYRIRLDGGDGEEVHAPYDSDHVVRSRSCQPEKKTDADEVGDDGEDGWPEAARIPPDVWAHNLGRWEMCRLFSGSPLDNSLYRPGGGIGVWSGRLDPAVHSWLSDRRPTEAADFAEELSPNIYSFRLFTAEFCAKLTAEIERCESVASEQRVPISRPNSMNRGGAILQELGLEPLMDSLQDDVLRHIAGALYPVVGAELAHHHSFVVRYSPSEDRQLDMHTDDSDVTFNVCLGKEFEGSGLQFCGVLGSPDHRQPKLRYIHEVGRCVVHLGMQRHGADVIRTGERISLISWNRNKVWRRSAGHLRPLHQIDYSRESGPPDPVCLSWTHDVDWEEHRGRRPGGRGQVRPWCPPAFARYAADD